MFRVRVLNAAGVDYYLAQSGRRMGLTATPAEARLYRSPQKADEAARRQGGKRGMYVVEAA